MSAIEEQIEDLNPTTIIINGKEFLVHHELVLTKWMGKSAVLSQTFHHKIL
jgi:hypothetical protein